MRRRRECGADGMTAAVPPTQHGQRQVAAGCSLTASISAANMKFVVIATVLLFAGGALAAPARDELFGERLLTPEFVADVRVKVCVREHCEYESKA